VIELRGSALALLAKPETEKKGEETMFS